MTAPSSNQARRIALAFGFAELAFAVSSRAQALVEFSGEARQFPKDRRLRLIHQTERIEHLQTLAFGSLVWHGVQNGHSRKKGPGILQAPKRSTRGGANVKNHILQYWLIQQSEV